MTINPSSQNVQKIFENVQAGGNITVGNITQIYKIVNNLSDIPQPTGFPHNIPSSNTKKFVGREKELVLIHQHLEENNSAVIAAVEGMTGVGKTELATQYSFLHLQLNTYPGGICWLQARDQNIGLQIIQFCRTSLGLQPPDNVDLLEQVSWCWHFAGLGRFYQGQARISHKQCDHNLYNPYRETVSGIFHGVDFLCNMETQNPVLIRV